MLLPDLLQQEQLLCFVVIHAYFTRKSVAVCFCFESCTCPLTVAVVLFAKVREQSLSYSHRSFRVAAGPTLTVLYTRLSAPPVQQWVLAQQLG